ncbi:SIMPL domain-containing protein [Robiginitalea sp. IMCC44478]|uniref:SIMPL domain-containing protein n=1 Tax=Robiginitalea sp. IMCC44478 TaxID=3459122 RepID=UPI004042704C
MKPLFISVFLLTTIAYTHAQQKNFLDQPYLETSARKDSLVTPDRLYFSILLQESDTKGRVSLEELEQKMAQRLTAIGIDLQKQLEVADLSSDFRKYFLRKQDILKEKAFQLVVYTAAQAGQALYELEQIGISNINLFKTEYSKMEELKLSLRALAVSRARQQAEVMTNALGQPLGKAIYISDNEPMIYGNVQRGLQEVVMTGMANTKEAYTPIASEFKKIRVEAIVQLKFLLE